MEENYQDLDKTQVKLSYSLISRVYHLITY